MLRTIECMNKKLFHARLQLLSCVASGGAMMRGVVVFIGLSCRCRAKNGINCVGVEDSASKRSIRRFVLTEKAPTRAFSWLKAATTAFTFKTLLRHAKWVLTPQ